MLEWMKIDRIVVGSDMKGPSDLHFGNAAFVKPNIRDETWWAN